MIYQLYSRFNVYNSFLAIENWAVTKSVKTLLSLFSSEARFEGVNLAPKGEVVRIC